MTDAGRTLACETERLLGALDRVVEAVQAQAGPSSGRLRIGASTTPGFYLLPSVLGRFHADRHDVELSYRVENSLRIEEAILKNELDLGFVGSDVPRKEIHPEPLVEDEIVFFADSAHRMSARRRGLDLANALRPGWTRPGRGAPSRPVPVPVPDGRASWVSRGGSRSPAT